MTRARRRPTARRLRTTIRLALGLLALSALGACAKQQLDARPIAWVLQGNTMGTYWKVLIPRTYAHDPAWKPGIEKLLARMNQAMSTYDKSSELSRFNASRSTEQWFACSAELARVAERALELHAQSDAAFDPTVGPLVNLWGFGPGGRKVATPSAEAVAKAKQSVGAKLLSVRREPPALRKRVAGLYVDLSAIAKGSAVDAVVEWLEAQQIADCFVDIGGEIRTRGHKRPRRVGEDVPAYLRSEQARPWLVAIERPSEDGRRKIHRTVALRDVAIATSGDYRNFYEVEGKRIAHGIDPRTGAPAEHALASVSVLATTCEDADAWATALMVLGPEEAQALAKRRGLAAFLLQRVDGGFKPWESPAFAKRFAK